MRAPQGPSLPVLILRARSVDSPRKPCRKHTPSRSEMGWLATSSWRRSVGSLYRKQQGARSLVGELVAGGGVPLGQRSSSKMYTVVPKQPNMQYSTSELVEGAFLLVPQAHPSGSPHGRSLGARRHRRRRPRRRAEGRQHLLRLLVLRGGAGSHGGALRNTILSVKRPHRYTLR